MLIVQLRCRATGDTHRKGTAMLSAVDKDNGYALAMEAHKDDGPFHCTECEEELILKQGRVKIAHFVHLPYSECS